MWTKIKARVGSKNVYLVPDITFLADKHTGDVRTNILDISSTASLVSHSL